MLAEKYRKLEEKLTFSEKCFKHVAYNFDSENIIGPLNFSVHAFKAFAEAYEILEDISRYNDVKEIKKTMLLHLVEMNAHRMDANLILNPITKEKWRDYLYLLEKRRSLQLWDELELTNQIDLWKKLEPLSLSEQDQVFKKISRIDSRTDYFDALLSNNRLEYNF